MGSAARHRERPEEPPPDASAVIADLGRIGDETDTIIGRMNRIDGGPQLILESILLAAHWAEAREQMEALAARLPSLAEVHRMGVEEGRRQAEREAAERAAAEQARPARHRHRKPHLTMVTGTAAVASLAASVAGGAYVAQDSALVHHWSAASPAAVRLHEGPADSAVPVPSWSPSARPSAAVASAHPAVTASPPPPSPSPSVPVPSSSPTPPPVTVPAGPVLVAPNLLDLAGSHFGRLPLSVTGPGEVAWTATATDGITLGSSAGVVVSGQTVELQVDDPTGNGGWIYFSAGSQAVAVHVVPFGAPAVALP